MKRLTKTYSDGTYGPADQLPCNVHSSDFNKMLIDRLGSFEDPQIKVNNYTLDVWGKPLVNYCVERDLKVVSDFVKKDDPATISSQEFQSMARIQLELYQMILKLTINYE